MSYKDEGLQDKMRDMSLQQESSEGRRRGGGNGGANGGGRKAKTNPDAAGQDMIKRNAAGGIAVNRGELKQAFEFFDVDKKGYITIHDLKRRLGVFYQNLSLREYKFLMNNKQEITEQDLYQLLSQNELVNYDPVAEAFKIYDPKDTGFVDLNVFKEILANLGFGEVTQQDIQTLIDTADVDGDGRVSLGDFRRMLTHANKVIED
jgi:Ca2+-binding EF-hand superfamily protein